ncbi:MAG: tetratricopeptide repeat protein [Polyangiaceae bacterium]
MNTTQLIAELESRFALDELKQLSQNLMGLDAGSIGGEESLGSFARALVLRAVALDAVEALCDAVSAQRPDARQKLEGLRRLGLSGAPSLPVGSGLGGYRIVEILRETAIETSYLVEAAAGDTQAAPKEEDTITRERNLVELTGNLDLSQLAAQAGRKRRLSVLRPEATFDRRGLQRFLTTSRISGNIPHPALPRRVLAGPLGEHIVVMQDHFSGMSLAESLTSHGPRGFEGARWILHALLDALSALHDAATAHGFLTLQNVLLSEGSQSAPALMTLGAGSSFLVASIPGWGRDRLDLLCYGLAPEQIQGHVPDARSDLYAFGALAYELMSGRAPFSTRSAQGLFERLTQDPPALTRVAAAGSVPTAISDLIAALMDRNPERRPRNAREVSDALERAGRRAQVPAAYQISEEEIQQRLSALLEHPGSEDLLAAVEGAVDQGADPGRIGDGLVWVSSSLAASLSRGSRTAQKRLLFRAAMIFETASGDLEKAESCYARIVETDAADGPAAAALERVRRRLGKHEALIEMLLERRELATSPNERAQALAEIGRIYKNDLDDATQALVAFAQAFAEDPLSDDYADEVERLAGKRAEAWTEAVQSLVDALGSDQPAEARVALLNRLGAWYSKQLSRPDLGLPCYQQTIALDPANTVALEGMTQLYRQARQWPELGMVLTARADAAATPAEARDFRAQAAELLASEMNDAESARALFEQVLEEDPHHPAACAGLDQLYASAGRHAERLVVLERRLKLATPEERTELLLAIADLCEFALKNPARALEAYESVIEVDPSHIDALKGADRLYSQFERWTDLLTNLELQLRVSVTPRQKTTLWSRVAAIHGEEFLDHGRAADALENLLDLEPNHQDALTALVTHYTALERWSDVAIVYERRLDAATQKADRVRLGLELAQILAEKAQVEDRAMFAYEQVLEIDPGNTQALSALAELRARSGDSHQALEAVEALAKKAETPAERARHYISAARLLEDRGDGDLAISRYELALQAEPTHAEVLESLETAYVARGELESALGIYERALKEDLKPTLQAALRTRRAALLWEQAQDGKRAYAEARRALDLDRQNLDAHSILARISHQSEDFAESAKLLEGLLSRSSQLSPDQRLTFQRNYVEALARTGDTARAVAEADRLLEISRTPSELRFVADLSLDHGSARKAFELYWELLHDPEQRLDPDERAELKLRVGQSALKSGDLDTAETQLQEALKQNPEEHRALRSLAELQGQRGAHREQVATLYELLQLAPQSEHFEILVQLGDVAADRLSDSEYATTNYLSALSKRPGDRAVLLKLMRLYSEGKDWARLVDVILEVADLVGDEKQRAKYLMTAANLCQDELADLKRAADLYQEVMRLDPSLEGVQARAIDVVRARGDFDSLKELLKDQLKRASEARDQARMLELMDELAQLYDQHFGRIDQSIALTQAALQVAPDGIHRQERLARLYARDPARYLDKALATHDAVLAKDPYRVSIYRSLFELYSRQRDSDSTWCVSQALYALNQASPEESTYFRQGRPGEPPTVSSQLSHEDWLNVLMHEDAGRLLTGVLALLGGTVLEVRGTPLEQLGYSEDHAVDPAARLPGVYTLSHDARCLGVTLPRLYQNSNDPRSLSLLHATPPCISLGQGALELRGRSRTFSFESARALAYFRPGFYVRHLVSSHKELRAWLSGAIRLFAPRFPVSKDIAEAAQGAAIAIERKFTPERRQALGKIVSELLQQGAALDLRRWMRGIDLTADRAGFLLCDDLPTALQVIRQAEEGDDIATRAERSKALVRFAVSPEYFRLRAQLGLRRG